MTGEEELDMKTQPWLINSFYSIAWPDPFIDQFSDFESNYLEDKRSLVYPEWRYKLGYSPPMIYIPSKIVLFKLMRACLGVETPDQFWLYNEKLIEEETEEEAEEGEGEE
jgi:hypothetical protein